MMNQDFRAPQDWFTSTNELHERVYAPYDEQSGLD